jgi:hypothetical protein
VSVRTASVAWSPRASTITEGPATWGEHVSDAEYPDGAG